MPCVGGEKPDAFACLLGDLTVHVFGRVEDAIKGAGQFVTKRNHPKTAEFFHLPITPPTPRPGLFFRTTNGGAVSRENLQRMMQYFGRDERYWRKRGPEEMRVALMSMHEPVEKSMMQRMAAAYEKLAEMAKSFSNDTTPADSAADPTKSRPDD